jgi:tetratricopeptide (TPR) repeat protein
LLQTAVLIHQRGELARAESMYRAVLEGDPENADALHNRGSALLQLCRSDEALASYEAALRLKPGHAFWPGMVALIRARFCQWNGLDERVAHIVDGILRGEPLSLPCALLAFGHDTDHHGFETPRTHRG